jgi:DUF4097 and DUF4098 domain-containing protein YvlB
MRRTISFVLFFGGAVNAFAVEQVQREFQRTVTLAPGRSFFVENSFGNVSIRTQTGRAAAIAVTIECSANSRERAESLCNQIEVSVQEGTDRVAVQTKVPQNIDGRNVGFQINYDIVVPQDTPLRVQNKFGAVSVSDLQANAVVTNVSGPVRFTGGRGRRDIDNKFGNIDVQSQDGDIKILNVSGDVTVGDIRGVVDINNRFGNITVVRASAGVTILNASGNVDARNITGPISVTNSFAPVAITAAASTVNVRNQSGAIRVDDAKESVDLRTQFEAITFSRIGRGAIVRGESSNITGDTVNGDVTVDTTFGSINLKGVRGNVISRAQSSSVRVEGVDGSVSAKTSFKELTITDVAGGVTADNESGAVSVEPRQVALCQPVAIRTRFAAVRFRVPAGTGYNLDARTRFGRINSELDVESVTRSASSTGNGQDVTLGGRIPGNRMCDLRIATESGNIDILKSTR